MERTVPTCLYCSSIPNNGADICSLCIRYRSSYDLALSDGEWVQDGFIMRWVAA